MRRTRSAVGTALLAVVSLGAPSAAYAPPVPLATRHAPGSSEQPTGASTIRLVTRGGRTRVLARVRNLGVLGVVSADRRLVAYDAGAHRNRTVVMRVRGGHVVASRSFGCASMRS